ncbi:MAG TPA: NHL repeat-containing protein [Chloroflexota bacterium]|nr:NHL repeat-containing protein [Chloroflexota bacterium]
MRALLLVALLLVVTSAGVLAESDQSTPAPAGIAVDSDGAVYVSDYAMDRVLKFGPDGTLLLQWGASGSGLGQFSAPFGLAVDDHTVYVVDQLNGRVQKFASDGTSLGAWGSTGAGSDQLRTPFGVAVFGGRVYVADFGNDRVQIFSTDGMGMGEVGAHGTADGQFQRPAGVAVDRDGNLYVTDHFNDRIQRFGVEGRFQGALGSVVGALASGTAVTSGTPGSLSGPSAVSTPLPTLTNSSTPAAVPESVLRRPEGIALDRDGNVWVADYGRDRVVKLSPEGHVLLALGSRGSGASEFVGPKGIAVDPASGRVYVADTGNGRVQRLAPDGTLEASWPLPSPAASAPSPTATVSATPQSTPPPQTAQ